MSMYLHARRIWNSIGRSLALRMLPVPFLFIPAFAWHRSSPVHAAGMDRLATGANGECRSCHQDEVDGFARTGMAHSMRRPGNEPSGAVRAGGATITVASTSSGTLQTLETTAGAQRYPVDYVIGSGAHASGALVVLGNHLFQSPIAFYKSRNSYDLAPGYENNPDPDYTRPVGEGCVFCHAGSNAHIPGTINAYGSVPFPHLAIGCDRCHGPSLAHLAKPEGSDIVNPKRLAKASRDSVCEQCHLIGVARILNPGKEFRDFQAGEPLEKTFTVFRNAAVAGTAAKFKVISHSEQLALSMCARSSGDQLWCGTCHNPHEEPSQPVAFYRERCLSCHAKTAFPAMHPALNSDCISCHMPKRDANDGGHSAFTDHRIRLRPEVETNLNAPASIGAWREPASELRKRNLGMAQIEVGVDRRSARDIVAGYRLLTEVQQEFPRDAAVFSSMGNALLLGRAYDEAAIAFERAAELDSTSAAAQSSLAQVYLALGKTDVARAHFERSLAIDPLNLPAIASLRQIYESRGQVALSRELSRRVADALQHRTEAPHGDTPK